MSSFDQELHRHERQLRTGFRQLRFEKSLEREFADFFSDHNLIRQRVAIVVGILLLIALLPLDTGLLQGEALNYYLISRTRIVIPLLSVALLLTFYKPLLRYFSPVSMLIITTLGVTTSWLVIFSRQQGGAMPYEGIMIIMMVGYFLGGLYFRQSLFSATCILVSYICLCELSASKALVNYHNYFFVFSTWLVGAVSAYALEYQIRFSFLQRGALVSLAQTDPLTGLYNRGAINQKLNHLADYAFREKKSVTLLMLDVDYFKNFNDFYGHLQGDQCLQRVAGALASCCKRPLDFVGRYGGEEFLVMWFDTQPSEAEGFAQRVLETIEQLAIRHDASPTHSHISISGGMVTGTPVSQLQAEKILQQADHCLYRAKASGRKRIVIQDLANGQDIAVITK